jgi:hypothetical protein
MSSVENRTKRRDATFCAGERSQHTSEHALGERSPICVIMRTRGSLNPAGTFDSLTPNSSLLIEVGN